MSDHFKTYFFVATCVFSLLVATSEAAYQPGFTPKVLRSEPVADAPPGVGTEADEEWDAISGKPLSVFSRIAERIGLTPRMGLNLEYLDNISLSKDDKKHDYITVISPGLTAQILEKTSGLKLSYDMGYSCYDIATENNTLRHNVQLLGWVRFSKHTRLDFQNAFRFTEEPVTDIELPDTEEEDDFMGITSPVSEETEDHLAETETIRRRRRHYYSNVTSVSFQHQFGEADSFSMKYVCDMLENKDPEIKDTTSHQPSVQVSYWPVPKRLGLEAKVSCERDESSETSLGDSGYWEEIVSPSLGLTYKIIPRELEVRTQLSYTRGDQSATTQGVDNWYESLRPSFGLNYWYIPYQLGIETSVSQDFENWRGSIKVNKKFTKHIQGFVKYTHTLMDFRGNGENYKVHDPSVGLTYTLAEGLPLSISLGYIFRDRQESEDDGVLSVSGDLGKTWEFSKHGSIRLTSSSGYDESYFGPDKLGFGIYYDTKCVAKYAFSRYISGDIYGAYRREKYVDLDQKRNDEAREIGSGITFQTRAKWLYIRLNYVHRTLDSTSSENDYEENRVYLQGMLSPFRPIRLFQ